jgi:tetratricopeptide (TPR) repeat protein
MRFKSTTTIAAYILVTLVITSIFFFGYYVPKLVPKLLGNSGLLVLMKGLSNTQDPDSQKTFFRAQSLLQKSDTQNKDEKTYKLGIGLALFLQGKENEAMEILHPIPNAASLLIQHGLHEQRSDRHQSALKWYNAAVILDPDIVDSILDEIGLAYLRENDLDNALISYQRLIEVSPDNRDAWYHLGKIYARKGSITKALEAWRKGIKLSRGKIGISNLYYQIGYHMHRSLNPPNLSAALEAYDKAIKLNNFSGEPTLNAECHYQRGSILILEERWTEAARDFERALESDSSHYWAHIALANTYYELNKTQEAILLLEKAIELEPNKKQAYRNLGKIHQAIFEYEAALSMYYKALEIDPNDKSTKKLLDSLNQEDTP